MKIGIFGGSFDPPHVGHEAIVNEALKELDIDKLIVVPTFLSPFKHEFFLPPATRLELLTKLFLKDVKIEVSDYEVNQNRSVYSIETVEHFQKHYSCEKIYLIIGEDNLEKLHLWSEFERLNDMVEFVVATRETQNNNPLLYPNFKRLPIDVDVSSTSIKQDLDFNAIPNVIQNDLKTIIQKV